METTGGNASWLNGINEGNNKSIHKMVRPGLLDSNKHANKWWCATETSAECYGCRINSTLDNTSPHFALYGQNSSIHELRTFGCDIYPITLFPKNTYKRAQEGSLMGYTNSIATMKWWDSHTKKIKYVSSTKFDEHNNKFGTG